MNSAFSSSNHSAQNSNAQFSENKGQWPKEVLFGCKMSMGILFVEKDGLTFNIQEPKALNEMHESMHHETKTDLQSIKGHAFKIKFLNTSCVIPMGNEAYSDLQNYFLGNIPSLWASGVKSFKEILLVGIYPNIDLKVYEKNGHLKYDFIIKPNGNPKNIQWKFEGINDVSIVNNQMLIKSSVGDIHFGNPFTFQKGKKINAEYVKNKGNIFTVLLALYNVQEEITIDPELKFASFTGSTADNFGYTATYDNLGCLYAAGISYNIGYPTSLGAYSSVFHGGFFDVTISKFNSTGNQLLYSTYLGGNNTESPHSIVVSNSNELIVFGSTGSTNFPCSANAIDTSYNGGTPENVPGISYNNGSDIFVTRFNSAGNAIVGSTFIGGLKNDGLNDEKRTSGLFHNYADMFRGEVIVDPNDNIYVATVTASVDFPIVGGFQDTIAGGNHDGVVMKLNRTLSNILWSSYLGGNNDDAAYSVQFDDKYDLFVAGGTKSSNFPTTDSALHTAPFGNVDGFITHISEDGSNIVASTYIGTAAYDQNYFVQLDKNNNVYVYGQTKGAYPIFPLAGVYSVPNSGQYMHKLSNDLSTTIFSTTFGAGSGKVELVPSAFLVNDCNEIYISGWGGTTNYYYPLAINNGTANFPVTSDAFQSSTDTSDFYLAVFSEDATNLKYATFFGGSTVSEHVDGGTSRFDKEGNIYQAVCAGCRSSDDFPTTIGAWSRTNNSPNCNLGVIKFDINKLTAIISGQVDTVACVNEPITFYNNSTGATSYHWDLGNGEESNEFQPTYAYADTGTYHIVLLTNDPNSCPAVDTTYLTLKVLPQVQMTVFPNDSICPGESVTLTASGANSYTWKPSQTLNQSAGVQVIATPTQQTTYIVNGDSYCNKDSAELTITLFSLAHEISPNDSVCPGIPHSVSASIGNSFSWTPANYFSNPNLGNTNVTLLNDETIHVNFKTINGCNIDDSIHLKVVTPPNVNSINDTLICISKSATLNPGINGNYQYKWQPNIYLNDANLKQPIATPPNNILYKAVVSNMCGIDTAYHTVNVSKVNGTISIDSTICSNDTIELFTKGGEFYLWSPGNTLTSDTINNPKAFPQANTQYKVIITNEDGCIDSLFTTVSIATIPYTGIKDEYLVEYGDDQQIKADFNNNIRWSPSTYLSCANCASPLIRIPEEDISYQYELYDDAGCLFKDSIHVLVIRKVYVPNAISTNGDGLNEVFYFKSISVEKFELMIFNRWGELLFTSDDINNGWDGTYKGQPVEIDTYVWKVRYKRFHKEVWHEEYGIVTVVK